MGWLYERGLVICMSEWAFSAVLFFWHVTQRHLFLVHFYHCFCIDTRTFCGTITEGSAASHLLFILGRPLVGIRIR